MPTPAPHSVRHFSFLIRHSILLLLAALPLLTLFHKNDLQQLVANRSLMAAPDEFSYLLTAQSLLQGHGISTQNTLGLDTFYPPGFPLILAAWSLMTHAGEVTPFVAHLLNALFLSAATVIVYFFARLLLILLSKNEHPRFRWGGDSIDLIALLIAGIFATNWHVLETALFVLAEPAFMLVVFAAIALSLKWRHWHLHPLQTLAVTLLAIAAWSIRGAGIVMVAVVFLYPFISLLHQLFTRTGPSTPRRRLACLLLILALAVSYQLILHHYSPEKSLLSPAASANSYPRQLFNGITARGTWSLSNPHHWPNLAERTAMLAMGHFDDFALSFAPWLRDPPNLIPRYLIGRIFALLAILGFLRHLASRNPTTRLLDLYLLCYFALYLLWPFNMTRFWSPILPIMLVFVVDAVRHFSRFRRTLSAQRTAAIFLALLLILNLEEITLQLGNYQRRLSNVSSYLAASASTVVNLSPDPSNTIVAVAGDDERFVFAWYLQHAPGQTDPGFHPLSPKPHLVEPDGPRETLDNLFLRCLDQMDEHPGARLFIISYFTETNFPEWFEKLRERVPERLQQLELHPVFRAEESPPCGKFGAACLPDCFKCDYFSNFLRCKPHDKLYNLSAGEVLRATAKVAAFTYPGVLTTFVLSPIPLNRGMDKILPAQNLTPSGVYNRAGYLARG